MSERHFDSERQSSTVFWIGSATFVLSVAFFYFGEIYLMVTTRIGGIILEILVGAAGEAYSYR
ncbi:MAG: hypothetical protein LKJ48_01760 [Lactobacillus sp.]|jgi:hypothetical protein|nr:hypothetical protein [Lactobacillus sp.]